MALKQSSASLTGCPRVKSAETLARHANLNSFISCRVGDVSAVARSDLVVRCSCNERRVLRPRAVRDALGVPDQLLEQGPVRHVPNLCCFVCRGSG